ncbi:hypothetical protein PENTCL1PPCAC_8772 [Pristionchus entomophagus]|uniref:Protein kinase domain-containing protein n=1 Tax=Pristionchus entomophagus TaxID=358040 RepID=A0AAV5SW52_9BILA|nr:hypothetical protein PENTCL1PPCAC_8772 [Pristionchus entomophagus]
MLLFQIMGLMCSKGSDDKDASTTETLTVRYQELLATVERLEEVQKVTEKEKENLMHLLQLAMAGNQSIAQQLEHVQDQLPRNHDLEFVSEFRTKFEPLDVLGQGGYGWVLKVKNNLDDWEYAVKRIALHKSKVDLKEALNEARAMASFVHPGIVVYNYSWIEEPPSYWQIRSDEKMLNNLNLRCHIPLYRHDYSFLYIQMELCQFTLSKWLDENKHRDLKRMKSWFRQIVSAVEYIHGKGKIHRDLKPCNILFASKDHLKICDMGIVIEQQVDGEFEKTMTVNGTGTEEYMSPEQRALTSLNISHVTSASDVFSLGLILAELCVVMTYHEKVRIFDNYRRGKPSFVFENANTVEFIGKLTVLEKRDRLTCKKMLDEMYLS